MRSVVVIGALLMASLALCEGAAAQDASAPPDAAPVVVYDIVVPQAAIPDRVGKIGVEEWSVRPGALEVIPYDNEGILGRGLLLESGTLVVTPAYDAWSWTGEAPIGGPPVVAPAGRPVTMSPGDVLMLPAVPVDQLDPAAQVAIANPGTDWAETFTFHLHWWEAFPGWPASIKASTGVTSMGYPELRRVEAGDTRFRLSRLTVGEGSTVPYPGGAALAFDVLGRGRLELNDRWEMRFPGEGTARTMDAPGVLRATGDGPTEVLELAVFPTAEATSDGATGSIAEPSTEVTPGP